MVSVWREHLVVSVIVKPVRYQPGGRQLCPSHTSRSDPSQPVRIRCSAQKPSQRSDGVPEFRVASVITQTSNRTSCGTASDYSFRAIRKKVKVGRNLLNSVIAIGGWRWTQWLISLSLEPENHVSLGPGCFCGASLKFFLFLFPLVDDLIGNWDYVLKLENSRSCKMSNNSPFQTLSPRFSLLLLALLQ